MYSFLCARIAINLPLRFIMKVPVSEIVVFVFIRLLICMQMVIVFALLKPSFTRRYRSIRTINFWYHSNQQNNINIYHDQALIDITKDDLTTNVLSVTYKVYQDLVDEYNALQNELQYIYALEQRNEAQLGSFVSVEAQWMAQDEDDRIMLTKKRDVEMRMEVIYDLIGHRYSHVTRR